MNHSSETKSFGMGKNDQEQSPQDGSWFNYFFFCSCLLWLGPFFCLIQCFSQAQLTLAEHLVCVYQILILSVLSFCSHLIHLNCSHSLHWIQLFEIFFENWSAERGVAEVQIQVLQKIYSGWRAEIGVSILKMKV